MTIASSPPDIDTTINLLIKRIENISFYIHEKAPSTDTLHRGGGSDYILAKLGILKKNLSLLSLKGKEECLAILNLLNDRVSSIKELLDAIENHPEEIIELFDIGIRYSDYQELDGVDGNKFINLEYDTSKTLSLEELGNLLSQIKYYYPELNISPYLEIQYQKANDIEKSDLSNKIITLRNEAIKIKTPQEEAYLKNLAFDLNLLVSSVGLEDQVTKINNVSEILDQITANETSQNIQKIENGYQKEAEKLYWPILLLNIAIIFIFLLIITVISLKFYAYFYQAINTNHKSEGILQFLIQIGKRPEDFIFFFSLIFSISALETYLIRERKRLIKLRDYFLFCDLELSSMPQYMRELNLEQRQNLYIDLSKNYFKGGDHDSKHENENTDNISDVLKKVEELTKIVKELKNN